MPRALTIAVVAMGMAILAGGAFLAATVVGRMTHREPNVAARPAASEQPFVAPPLELPKGAQVEAVGTGSDRAVLALRMADGNRELIVIDLVSGRLVETVPLQTAP